MSMQRLWLILAVCIVGGLYGWWNNRTISHGPGVLVPDPPYQQRLADSITAFERNGHYLQPLARFEAKARVLGKKNYRHDAGAALSPVDLALGWGRMSDSAVLARIDIRQSGRFYFWRTEEFPIPRHEIESHSANMHMIPASPTIADQLDRIRTGHIVQFSGYLVEARRPDGWRWRSSLTRDDTGAGACEVIWVETLEVYD